MKNLPLAGFRPLLAVIFLFVFILGCRKDNLIIDNPRTDSIRQPGRQFPITAEEAKVYFEKLDLHASNSLNGGNPYSFIGIDPMWNNAFTGYSQSGKEMIVVPLADSSIRMLNDGRADTKLLFTKISSDTIEVQIILYVADTAYYTSNGHTLNFNNFSGVFAFFDLTYHFQYGIALENGAPVSEIDTVGFIDSGAALDRYNCWEGGIYVMCDGPVEQVFTSNAVECTAVMFLQGSPCDGNGGGGGGGGGGTGGGSGGTGGGGYGTGGTGNTNFWSIFYSNTPVNVFLANGGTLPNGLDLTRAQHLVEINQVYHLSQPNLHWLADNILVLDAVYNYLINHPTPTGNELNAVARLIELSKKCNLTSFQQLFLASHLDEVNDMYLFAASKNFDSASKQAVSSLIDLKIKGKFPAFEAEDFIDPGLFADFIINCGLLRAEHPDWNSGEIYLTAVWRSITGYVHTALDICGLIPAGGEPCDLVNGVIYTLEGNPTDASLSFAATLPIAGWAATGAKWAGITVLCKGVVHNLDVKLVNGIVDFGNREKLRSILGITNTNKEAHHVIPWEFVNKPLTQAAGKGNFHMNHPFNGLELDKFRFDMPDGVHANHPQYNAKVQNLMDDLWSRLTNYYGGEQNVPVSVAKDKLIELQQVIVAHINENPSVKINLLTFNNVVGPNVP